MASTVLCFDNNHLIPPLSRPTTIVTLQTQFLTATTCEEAHRLFQSSIDLSPRATEVIPVDNALGRIAAVPITARTNVPGFDRSNFDGFAIQSSGVVGATESRPVELELLPGKIPAGQKPVAIIGPGQAISISTGGMIPRGANAVCLVENTTIRDSNDKRVVVINRSSHAGSGISFAGSDISQGETVIRPGQTISSRETGVLAAIGETTIEVYGRPKVAVISTGDEIIPPGESIQPGQVYDSNARIIADAIREVGGIPLELGIAIDQLDDLKRLVNKALELADVVLLSGGTSKGEGDLSYQVVSQYRDPGIVVHGVALKPGKPVCLAATEGKPLVVLPGFPTSAIFTFHEFVAPVIRHLSGKGKTTSSNTISARLAQRVNSEIGRTEFLLVGLLSGLNSESEMESRPMAGLPKAYPMGKGSGSVTTFSRADGFITIERNTEILDEGETVNVQLIGNRTQPADLVVMGSHCQKLDQVVNEVQQSGYQVKVFAIGSTAGLNAAKKGDCDIAGIHLYDPNTGTYNKPFVSSEISIQNGYARTQGLVYRKDDQSAFESTGLNAIELFEKVSSNPELMMVNRNQGSGTRILIDRLLADTGCAAPQGYEIQVSNHHAVCAAVVQERADWGIAIETVAKDSGLGFIPLEDEQFDFAIPKSRLSSRPVQAFLDVLAKMR